MTILVSVIGSPILVKKIERNAQIFSNLKLIYFPYNDLNEVKSRVQEAAEYADIFLFTGIIPYQIAKDEVDRLNKVAFHLVLDDYSVVLGLYEALIKNNQIKFSIDYTLDVNLQNIFNDLQIDSSNVYKVDIKAIYEDEGLEYSKKIMQFHEKLYREKKISKIITCLSNVSKFLELKKIPHIRIVHSDNVIMDVLNSISNYNQLEVSRGAQLFIAKYRVNQYEKIVEGNGSYFVEKNILELNKILLEVASDTFSTLQRTHKDEFTIYGTYGAFKMYTENLLDFTHINEIEKLLDISINIGFGTGYTTKDAENNAIKSLEISKRSKKSEAYLINERGQIFGPFNRSLIDENQLFSNSNENWILKASKTGINLQVLNRIFQYSKLQDFEGFTANDLAAYLLTGKRSAERYIKILMEEHLLEEAGMKRTSMRGRNSKVYKISF